MRQIIYFFTLFSLTLLLLAPNLAAAKIGGEALTIPYQVKNSDRIIIGTVSGIDTYSNYTIYTIIVKEWLYNPLPSETIKVISYIGTIDEKEDEVEFTHLNESSLLMLEDENPDKLLFRVFVGKLGKHPISDRGAVIKELETQGKWQKGNIDTLTNNTTSTVNVGNYSESISVSSDGKKVYVTNLGKPVANISDSTNGTVYVFDRENNSYIASLPVGKWPWSVAANPDITKVYLNNNSAVSIIDTANNTDSHIESIGEWTWAVALNPNRSKVYVADQSSDN